MFKVRVSRHAGIFYFYTKLARRQVDKQAGRQVHKQAGRQARPAGR